MRGKVVGLLVFASVFSGCAFEVEYVPDYVPIVAPTYLAETQLVVLMGDEDARYDYEGRPESFVGQAITLTIPIGAIMREIIASVFRSHFNYGVLFTQRPEPDLRYIVAIEPEIRDFSYRYDRVTEPGVLEMRATDDGYEAVPVTIITPSIQFELALKVFNASGQIVMEKVYPSGLVAGESYVVTSRPHERINATFHAALQQIMLTVASDIRPLLAAQPNLLDPE